MTSSSSKRNIYAGDDDDPIIPGLGSNNNNVSSSSSGTMSGNAPGQSLVPIMPIFTGLYSTMVTPILPAGLACLTLPAFLQGVMMLIETGGTVQDHERLIKAYSHTVGAFLQGPYWSLIYLSEIAKRSALSDTQQAIVSRCIDRIGELYRETEALRRATVKAMLGDPKGPASIDKMIREHNALITDKASEKTIASSEKAITNAIMALSNDFLSAPSSLDVLELMGKSNFAIDQIAQPLINAIAESHKMTKGKTIDQQVDQLKGKLSASTDPKRPVSAYATSVVHSFLSKQGFDTNITKLESTLREMVEARKSKPTLSNANASENLAFGASVRDELNNITISAEVVTLGNDGLSQNLVPDPEFPAFQKMFLDALFANGTDPIEALGKVLHNKLSEIGLGRDSIKEAISVTVATIEAIHDMTALKLSAMEAHKNEKLAIGGMALLSRMHELHSDADEAPQEEGVYYSRAQPGGPTSHEREYANVAEGGPDDSLENFLGTSLPANAEETEADDDDDEEGWEDVDDDDEDDDDEDEGNTNTGSAADSDSAPRVRVFKGPGSSESGSAAQREWDAKTSGDIFEDMGNREIPSDQFYYIPPRQKGTMLSSREQFAGRFVRYIAKPPPQGSPSSVQERQGAFFLAVTSGDNEASPEDLKDMICLTSKETSELATLLHGIAAAVAEGQKRVSIKTPNSVHGVVLTRHEAFSLYGDYSGNTVWDVLKLVLVNELFPTPPPLFGRTPVCYGEVISSTSRPVSAQATDMSVLLVLLKEKLLDAAKHYPENQDIKTPSMPIYVCPSRVGTREPHILVGPSTMFTNPGTIFHVISDVSQSIMIAKQVATLVMSCGFRPLIVCANHRVALNVSLKNQGGLPVASSALPFLSTDNCFVVSGSGGTKVGVWSLSAHVSPHDTQQIKIDAMGTATHNGTVFGQLYAITADDDGRFLMAAERAYELCHEDLLKGNSSFPVVVPKIRLVHLVIRLTTLYVPPVTYLAENTILMRVTGYDFQGSVQALRAYAFNVAPLHPSIDSLSLAPMPAQRVVPLPEVYMCVPYLEKERFAMMVPDGETFTLTPGNCKISGRVPPYISFAKDGAANGERPGYFTVMGSLPPLLKMCVHNPNGIKLDAGVSEHTRASVEALVQFYNGSAPPSTALRVFELKTKHKKKRVPVKRIAINNVRVVDKKGLVLLMGNGARCPWPDMVWLLLAYSPTSPEITIFDGTIQIKLAGWSSE